MRPIPKKSQGHFVGQTTFLNSAGRFQIVGFESLNEYRTGLISFYRPGFYDLEEQIGPIVLRMPDGRKKEHFLDFRLTFKNGVRYGLSVKPNRKAVRDDFEAEMKALKIAGKQKVFDRLFVVTERHICPVQLANAELYHAAREPEPDLDAEVIGRLSDIRDRMTIEQAIERTGLEGRALYSIMRHIRTGNLNMGPVGRIGLDTVVSVARAG